jgi:beta-N-acetylhexosaminidase
MNYKEIASLYVAHMSLDEKLGQMIMTESEQNNYSDDLNYMITQLHVGGMIMYESHLQTASQARTTTSLAQQNAKIPLLTWHQMWMCRLFLATILRIALLVLLLMR